MKVRYGNKTYEFSESMTAQRLLEKLQILPETVVVVRGDEVVTEDETLEAEDEVELIRVISGGSEKQ